MPDLVRKSISVGWASAPDPAGPAGSGGSLQCSPDPLAGFKGHTSKRGREVRGGEETGREGALDLSASSF